VANWRPNPVCDDVSSLKSCAFACLAFHKEFVCGAIEGKKEEKEMGMEMQMDMEEEKEGPGPGPVWNPAHNGWWSAL